MATETGKGADKQTYTVEALETFTHRTTYTVEATSYEEAERLCKAGGVAYDDSEVVEGDEVWVETTDIRERE